MKTPTAFFDRNFPKGLALALKEICAPQRKVNIIPHVEWFEHDTPDTVWIPQVASHSPKPFVVGGDGAILHNEAEAQALKESGLTYFLLASGFTNFKIYDQAWKFIKAWEEILASYEKQRAPAIYEVSVHSKVTMKHATADIVVPRPRPRPKASR